MSCDQHFERCLQNKFDTIFQAKSKTAFEKEISATPHRLIGTEVWLEAGGKEEIFLEGVTGIEFREGNVIFQTVLGERISFDGELERVTLREGGVVLQTK
jgi:predicted RNA-binding protein